MIDEMRFRYDRGGVLLDAFSRTRLLLGEEGMEKLKNARVAVFGLGGVGGYVVEALARSGVGALDLIDHDTVSVTNINRQLLALHSTIGLSKAEAAKRRVLDINPEARVVAHEKFYGPDTAAEFDFTEYDYIVDAIDTVTAKLALIDRAKAVGTPILCCLGTGNKLDPTRFQITDISKTSGCPLARVVRKELRARNIFRHKVLFSPEEPLTHIELEAPPPGRRSIPASVSWVPSVAGLMIAGHIVLDLTKE
jgi:tRNA A37 threonylcarbamoyladenosine dehydratase